MFVRGTYLPGKAGCMGSLSAKRVSPYTLQWDCGRDGSRSPAAGARSLLGERQAPGEMGSPFSKRKTDFCLIRFQFAEAKGVEGMVCKSHGDCKGKDYSLVICWWKSPRLPVPRMEVTGSACRKLLACEWENGKKERVSDSKGLALLSSGWKCLPGADCLQNTQQENGGAEQRPD